MVRAPAREHDVLQIAILHVGALLIRGQERARMPGKVDGAPLRGHAVIRQLVAVGRGGEPEDDAPAGHGGDGAPAAAKVLVALRRAHAKVLALGEVKVARLRGHAVVGPRGHHERRAPFRNVLEEELALHAVAEAGVHLLHALLHLVSVGVLANVGRSQGLPVRAS